MRNTRSKIIRMLRLKGRASFDIRTLSKNECVELLKTDVAVWNESYRNTQQVAGTEWPYYVDLSYSDLSGADLRGVYLKGANLTHSDMSGVNLSDADILNAKMSHCMMQDSSMLSTFAQGATFEYTNLSGADMRGAWFDNASMIGASMNRADLRDASFWGANMYESNFKNIATQNIDFRYARFGSSTKINLPVLDGVKLNDATLMGHKLTGKHLRMPSDVSVPLDIFEAVNPSRYIICYWGEVGVLSDVRLPEHILRIVVKQLEDWGITP